VLKNYLGRINNDRDAASEIDNRTFTRSWFRQLPVQTAKHVSNSANLEFPNIR